MNYGSPESIPGQKSASRKRDAVDRRQLLRSPRSPFLDSFRIADNPPIWFIRAFLSTSSHGVL